MKLQTRQAIIKDIFDRVYLPFIRSDIVVRSGKIVHAYCKLEYDPEKDEIHYEAAENDYHNRVSGTVKYDHSVLPSNNIRMVEEAFLKKVYDVMK